MVSYSQKYVEAHDKNLKECYPCISLGVRNSFHFFLSLLVIYICSDALFHKSHSTGKIIKVLRRAQNMLRISLESSLNVSWKFSKVLYSVLLSCASREGLGTI